MLPYIFINLLLLFLAYFYDYLGKKKGKTQFEYIVLSLLILMAGFRYHIGGDTINYIEAFDDAPLLTDFKLGEGNIKNALQPLWFVTMSLCKTIYADFTLFQFIVAVVINLLLYRYCKKSTSYVFSAFFVSFFIVWIYYNFETIREAVCVGVYLNSLFLIRDGKVKKFLVANVPCLFIHYFSVVIVVLTLLLYYISLRKTILLISVLSLFFLMLNGEQLERYVFGLLLIAGENFAELSEKYMENSVKGFSQLNIFGIISVIVYLLMPLFIAISLSKNSNKVFEAKLAWLFVFLFVATAKLQILNRFENYLWFFIIIEVINYLSKIRYKVSYLIVLFVLVLNVWKYMNYFYMPSPSQADIVDYDYRFIPYKTVFEDPDPFRERMYLK